HLAIDSLSVQREADGASHVLDAALLVLLRPFLLVWNREIPAPAVLVVEDDRLPALPVLREERSRPAHDPRRGDVLADDDDLAHSLTPSHALDRRRPQRCGRGPETCSPTRSYRAGRCPSGRPARPACAPPLRRPSAARTRAPRCTPFRPPRTSPLGCRR